MCVLDSSSHRVSHSYCLTPPLPSFRNNTRTHIQAWAYEQVRVPGTRGVLNWSSGLLRDGEWLYLVGVHGEGIAAKQVLARVPCEAAATRLDFAEMEGACRVRVHVYAYACAFSPSVRSVSSFASPSHNAPP